MKNLSSPLFVILFLILIPSVTVATKPLDVVINENAWMGTKISYNDEWVELYNNTDNTINLGGWLLKAIDGTPKINLTGVIPGKSFYLLERTDDNTVPEISADQIFTGALGNSGENLELYDNSGNLIDSLTCASGWFAGDNTTKQTMERKNSQLSGSDSSNWQTSQNPGGTPEAKNSEQGTINNEQKTENLTGSSSLPAPLETKEYPPSIVINEILSSPEGPDTEEEWIEIFNQNNFEVDLSEWQLTDTVGKTTTYSFPMGTKILPQGFLVISRPITKITLNNDGDGLNLIQPNGKIIDSVIYEKAPRGQSYNRIDSQWTWSNVLTPGLKNQIPAPEIKKESSKELIKETNSPLSPSSNLKEISLATVSKDFPKEKIFFSSFLAAFFVATFSAIIIFVLKKEVEKSKKID